MTDVTVVIPTRDRPGFLRVTLQSVLWQRGVDLEVVIVDDGSRLDLRPVIDAFGDARVRVIRHPVSAGVARARNHGIEVARGRWLAFTDDDDVWAPDKLDRQLEVAESAGRAWTYVGFVEVNEDLEVIGAPPAVTPEDVMSRLGAFNPVPGGGSGVVARRDLVRDVGGFDASFQTVADWELWMRFGAHGPPADVPLPLLGYRIHSTNMSLDTTATVREAERIAAKHGAPVEMAAVHAHLAGVAMRAGRRGLAARQLLLAEAARSGRGSALVPVFVAARVARRILGGASRPGAPEHWIAEARAWLADLARLVA